MFTSDYRESVREKIISTAKADARIVAAAIIGSYAKGTVDRWSDIDLTFGVAEEYEIAKLLDSLTEYILTEFNGKKLFDVQSGNTIYRVFVLPGCLQVDLSFSPVNDFGAIGEYFHLLYGKQYPKLQPNQQPAEDIFGYLIHHLMRARFCIERNKFWQAEFWLNESRNYTLKLACQARGLSTDYGRGFDDLPEEALAPFQNAFIKTLSKEELLRVLKIIVLGIPNTSNYISNLYKIFDETLIGLMDE